MALSNFARTNTMGQVILTDGTGTPVTLTSLYDLGDLSISGLGGDNLNEVQVFTARERKVSTAPGARRFPQITFSALLTGESATAPGSLQAFCARQAPYTANISTEGVGRPYAFNVTFRIEGTDFGVDDWETTFHDCVCSEFSISEALDANKVSFTLMCYGEITGSLTLSEIS